MVCRSRKVCTWVVAALSIGVTGCFGESILSATTKLLTGQLSQLTATEIQILNESVLGIIASQNPGFTGQVMTKAQAEALSNFLKANNINNIDDIEALKQLAANNPDAIEGLDELAAAFADSDVGIDEGNAEDSLDAIVQALFGTGSTGGSNPGGGNTGGGNSGGAN